MEKSKFYMALNEFRDIHKDIRSREGGGKPIADVCGRRGRSGQCGRPLCLVFNADQTHYYPQRFSEKKTA